MHAPTPAQVRTKLLLLCVVGVLALFTARLIDLQVRQHAAYASLADDNRLYDQRVTPLRGSITDRFGTALTQSSQRFWQKLNPNSLFSEEQELARNQALQLIASDSAQVRVAYGRRYPMASVAAQTIGYVGLPSSSDLQSVQGLSLQQFIGKSGLEKTLDETLRGSARFQRYELNALGVPQRVVEPGTERNGHIVQTTLDPYLSQRASQLLAGKKGAVVVIDADTGEVLSLVSQPSFDPNVFVELLSADEAERSAAQLQVSALVQDPAQPLFNRAISGAYPPGSVFKLVTAAAALETQAVTADTQVLDEGVLTVGDFSYNNWYYSQYGGKEGEIALERALARSNDIYFYKAAEWTGPARLAQFARLLGLGKVTGIELPGETAGLIPDPDWKEQTTNEKWYLGNTYHMGIGQGDVLVTPLQVASVTQALGHEGVRCQPHVVTTRANTCEGVGLQESTVELVLAGLVDACSPGGTGVPFFSWNKRIRDSLADQSGNPEKSALAAYEAGAVACKTGTAEFGGQDSAGRRRTHAWFTLSARLPDHFWKSPAEAGSVLNENTESSESSSSGDLIEPDTATVASTGGELRAAWLEQVEKQGYPTNIALAVLVESDEVQPFAEGSRDAAPIALELLEWLRGE